MSDVRYAVGRFCLLLPVSLVVGGGVLYTFVLTPAIFAAYPRNAAGEIVGTMMPHYFRFQFAALAFAAPAALALRRVWSGRRRAVVLALVLGALALQSFVQWRLYPRILEVKSRVATFESAPDAPERRRFRALHGLSMGLNLLILADGILLLALLPPRRPPA